MASVQAISFLVSVTSKAVRAKGAEKNGQVVCCHTSNTMSFCSVLSRLLIAHISPSSNDSYAGIQAITRRPETLRRGLLAHDSRITFPIIKSRLNENESWILGMPMNLRSIFAVGKRAGRGVCVCHTPILPYPHRKIDQLFSSRSPRPLAKTFSSRPQAMKSRLRLRRREEMLPFTRTGCIEPSGNVAMI